MTKNSAISTARYEFATARPIHLDANILMYLHPPLGKLGTEAKVYGPFVAKARAEGAPLRVSILVIGEYVNTYSRLIFNSLFRGKYGSFKKFRASEDWSGYAKDIGGEIKQILSYCEVLSALSDNESAAQHIEDFSKGGFDFNDQLITHSCHLDDGHLLTNDGDMTTGGLLVITENTKLIAACT